MTRDWREERREGCSNNQQCGYHTRYGVDTGQPGTTRAELSCFNKCLTLIMAMACSVMKLIRSIEGGAARNWIVTKDKRQCCLY